jgi:hypothetical protein
MVTDEQLITFLEQTTLEELKQKFEFLFKCSEIINKKVGEQNA